MTILLLRMFVWHLLEKENILVIKTDGKLTKNKKKYFVGTAILNELSKTIATKELKVYSVLFKRGARTKLHYHTAEQLLIRKLRLLKKNWLKKEQPRPIATKQNPSGRRQKLTMRRQ